MAEPRQENLLGNILAIVGLIIVLFIGIWGLTHLVSISRDFFASFLASRSTGLIVSAPKAATAGDPILISWNYAQTAPGTYSFLYACKPGLQLSTADRKGDQVMIPCGTPFAIASSTRAISVIASLTSAASSPLDIPISIIYTQSGVAAQAFSTTVSAARAEGTATIAITRGAAAPHVAATPAAKKQEVAKTASPKSVSAADLSVHIISADMGRVVFDIKNVGGSTAGAYYFTVELPTDDAYAYTSPLQHALTPGSHVVSTLTYDNLAPQGGAVTVTVDPENRVAESRSSNNTANAYVNGYGY